MSEANPSAGVLRAAKRFVRHSKHIYRWRDSPEEAEQDLTQVIEAETAHTKLLEAAKLALPCLPGDREYAEVVAGLHQAVAKAENTDTNSPEVRRARGAM